MAKETLFWLFIGIFAVTAIITLLGITGVLKNIKDKYLNTLFTALILEVIAAVFFLFQNFDFTENSVDLGAMITKSGLSPPAKIAEQEDFIINQLTLTKNIKTLENENAKLKEDLTQKEAEIKQLKGDFNQIGQSFYSLIIQLDKAIDEYPGHNINIGFQPEKKEKVYQILVNIFSELGKIKDGDAIYNADKTINKPFIRKLYSNLRSSYGREVLEDAKVYIDEFDASQMVKYYLEKK